MSRERFVVHLPVAAEDLVAARRLARVITRALGFLADIDRGGTTVSREDAHSVHHWVYCDRRLAGRRRCSRPADHDGGCDHPTAT
ncbi:hypothetical protein OG271_07930 [Micromonospora rifamycinica]|uniref:hypothetical protein n=1 Tax=Micromonospora rifamycinica TaxID=291594 RepID=UPI002E288BB7|nr:hypothetical protein [Micromonospora rifamycinica]